MDWIERWLVVSPDGGNGSLETALVVVAFATVLLVISGARTLEGLQRLGVRHAMRRYQAFVISTQGGI